MDMDDEYIQPESGDWPIYVQDCICEHPLEAHEGAYPGGQMNDSLELQKDGCQIPDCKCKGVVIDDE